MRFSRLLAHFLHFVAFVENPRVLKTFHGFSLAREKLSLKATDEGGGFPLIRICLAANPPSPQGEGFKRKRPPCEREALNAKKFPLGGKLSSICETERATKSLPLTRPRPASLALRAIHLQGGAER